MLRGLEFGDDGLRDACIQGSNQGLPPTSSVVASQAARTTALWH
jgi:hypothetical protein